MAIDNFNVGSRQQDLYIIKVILFIFIIVAWLMTPPGNKFLQVCFWGHNVQYAITRIIDKNSTEEYKFYWTNAVYLAKFKDKKAINEMDKAIEMAPVYFNEDEIQILYRERAKIKIALEDYKGAIDDYLKVKTLDEDDALRLALAFKKIGKRSMALSQCNHLLTYELSFDNAYSCIADVYADAGKYESSVKVFDYLISRDPANPSYYLSRAKYKKLNGDVISGNMDLNKVKSLDPEQKQKFLDVTDVMLVDNIKFAKVF